MIPFDDNSFKNAKHVLLWIGLAFQAGAINAGGFLACSTFVSHVTGIGTMVGIQMASGHFFKAFELLAVPASFVSGAVISAILTDGRKMRGLSPLYWVVMLIVTLLIGFALAAGNSGWFGIFGEPFEVTEDTPFVAALCLACGLQNACISSATRNMIRSTHLTGTLTDIGISWVRIKNYGQTTVERTRELTINRVRILSFLAFSIGSAVSTLLYLRFHYTGLFLPFSTSLIFFAISLTYRKELCSTSNRP